MNKTINYQQKFYLIKKICITNQKKDTRITSVKVNCNKFNLHVKLAQAQLH